MKKVYETHEIAYQKLKSKGAKSWHEMYATKEGQKVNHIGADRKNFLENILDKEWSPKNGKALEIGCGIGNLINWLTSKGFTGTGIDISQTAIEMAKEQNFNSAIDFIKGDYCFSDIFEKTKFDLIVDGSCFHCIVEDSDRKVFLEKSYNLLDDNGLFILFSSCSPINKKNFSDIYKTEKFKKGIFYVPYNVELEGSKVFAGNGLWRHNY